MRHDASIGAGRARYGVSMRGSANWSREGMC